MKTFVGVVLGVVGWIIVSDRREFNRRQRRSGPVWTDAARWEKKGRDY